MKALLTLLLAAAGSRAEDFQDLIDPIAAKLLARGDTVSFVVGVRQGSKTGVYGYGKSSLPGGRRTPDGDTIFEIGSITKAFTGVLLAEAVRRGEIKLGDPAATHLPADVPLPAAITIAHLATHRSGLPIEPPLLGLTANKSANPYADFDRARLSGLLAKLDPDPPGKKHVYSNLGAGLLGIALVHEAKAANYDTLVKERITRPLGMVDTTEALTGAQRARLAGGHNDKGKPVGPWDFACLEACGGLRSSVNDLLKFADANLSEPKPGLFEAIDASHKPLADVKGQHWKIGCFWQISERDSGPMIWHNGGTGGYCSMLAFIPKTRTAVVLLCAAAEDQVDATAFEILKAIQPK